MTNSMLVIYTEKHKLHDPPKQMLMGKFSKYQEMPSRMDSVMNAIKQRNVGEIVGPVDYGLDPILAIHSQEYLDYFQTAYEEWLKQDGNPDGVMPDTYAVRLDGIYRDISAGGPIGKFGYYSFDLTAVIAKDTFEAAYEAAQVAITGAVRLIQDKRNAVFSVCRPPGHHSDVDLAGGYCFLNNAAIATEYLIKTLDVGNVVCLDVDFHHGNGTQTIFYNRRNPMYVSLHGDPDYPYYWGKTTENGSGDGIGSNINVPLPIGTDDTTYMNALNNTIDTNIIPFQPKVLVVSLGVDTFVDDPVGSFSLTSECFVRIGEAIRRIGVPTLFVMEGGYDVAALGTNVTNVLLGFTSN